MFIPSRKISIYGAIATLLVFMAWVVYSSSTYTSNLQERPFNAGIVGQISTLDPAQITSHEEKLVASAMYEGLVSYDENAGVVKPNLAQQWKISNDGRKIIIKLKKNVLFHNGKKMTAADVKHSWEKSLPNNAQGDKSSLFAPIEGAEEKQQGSVPEITGIKVVDDYTLNITLKKANAAFIFYLTNPAFWVKDTEDKTDILPGTGPFKFKEWGKQNLILTRHEKYHRGLPKLTELQVIMYANADQALADYKARKLDYLDQVPLKQVKEIREAAEYRNLHKVKPVQSIYTLGFNCNKEPFADNYLLRRALNYAIDRKAIIDNITGGLGIPLKGACPMGLPGYNKEMRGYSYDPERARELLSQAGYPDGQGLETITLTFNESAGHRRVAEAVAAQLQPLGIPVELRGLNWEPYVKQIKGGTSVLFRVGWKADYPDSDTFLYSLFHSSRIGISNFAGYRNPQVDKILEASRAETISSQERIKLLRRAEEIVVDDAPMVWLFQQEAFKMIGPDVGGFKVDTMEMIDWFSLELRKPEIEEKPAPNSPQTKAPDNKQL